MRSHASNNWRFTENTRARLEIREFRYAHHCSFDQARASPKAASSCSNSISSCPKLARTIFALAVDVDRNVRRMNAEGQRHSDTPSESNERCAKLAKRPP